MSDKKNVLIIGGHGKVALKLAPLLVRDGFSVHSLIRDPDQSEDITKTGANPVVKDVASLTAEEWDELLIGVDAIVWSAGAGGKGGTEATYAVDRDAAIASIDAAQRSENSPRYIMVSFWGSTTVDLPEDNSLYHYSLAKRAADHHLLDSSLDFAILAPTALTMERAKGIDVHTVEDTANQERPADTSRELVAHVAAYEVEAPTAPNKIIPFADGDSQLADALG